MILLIKKDEKYQSGSNFPFMTVPLRATGEPLVFDDFQWWAPTSKWQEWLKKNPSSWSASGKQAESEFFSSEEEGIFEDNFGEEKNPPVLGFDEFKSVFEENGGEGAGEETPATSAQTKAYTKFVFALNKLKESRGLNGELNTSSLQTGGDYAFIMDLPGGDGQPDEFTKQAFRMKIGSDSGKAFVAVCTESLPFGELPESGDGGGGNAISAIAEWGARIAASGIAGFVVIGGAIKATTYILGKMDIANRIRNLRGTGSALSGLSRMVANPSVAAVTGWYDKSGVLRPASGLLDAAGNPIPPANCTYVRAGDNIPGIVGKAKKGSIFRKGRGFYGGVKNALQSRKVLGRSYAKAALKGATRPLVRAGAKLFGKGFAKGASRFIPYAGQILLLWDIIQVTANWYGDNQAPMLSDLKDEGWAVDYFAPGSIENGEQITICWSHTPDTWGNFFSGLVWDSSTRTTMNLIKIANFDGRAIFLLADINSKEFQKVLQEKELVILSFDESTRFERGMLDNDNLRFEMISYDKGEGDFMFNLFFNSYCNWNEFESAYNGAEDTFLAVPQNAPREYSFHFKYGKADHDVNVTGTIVQDVNSIEGIEKAFESQNYPLSQGEDNIEKIVSYLSESSDVLSFEKFSKLLEENNDDPESEQGPMEGGESEENTPEETESEVDTDTDTEENPRSSAPLTAEHSPILTGTVQIALYEVNSIEYADSRLRDLPLPGLDSFIVPNNYLEAKDQENILVDPIQEVSIKWPQRGSIAVESESVPDPVLPDTTPDDGKEGVTGGVQVQVTKDELINTYKDRPEVLNSLGIPDVTKIKDKDKQDKISVLAMITPEEREKLGLQDFGFIRKVKIYRDGKTREPIGVKFKGEGKTVKFRPADENFYTALKVAERVEAGFKQEGEEED